MDITFYAERLVEGREARGLSQLSLADCAGIRKSEIVAFESGKKIPSQEQQARLSDVLNLPLRFFRINPPRPEESVIFW